MQLMLQPDRLVPPQQRLGLVPSLKTDAWKTEVLRTVLLFMVTLLPLSPAICSYLRRPVLRRT